MNTEPWGKPVYESTSIEVFYRGEWVKTRIVSQAFVGNTSQPAWHVVTAMGLHWNTGQYTPEYRKIAD